MERVIEQIESWEDIKRLPKELVGFKLNIQMLKGEGNFYLFSYEYPEIRRTFSVMYSSATKEYFARINIGLTQYCDIDFITAEINRLEEILSNTLVSKLSRLIDSVNGDFCTIFKKKITEWFYGKMLPE
jgi:hypothetical protein